MLELLKLHLISYLINHPTIERLQFALFGVLTLISVFLFFKNFYYLSQIVEKANILLVVYSGTHCSLCMFGTTVDKSVKILKAWMNSLQCWLNVSKSFLMMIMSTYMSLMDSRVFLRVVALQAPRLVPFCIGQNRMIWDDLNLDLIITT